MRVTIRVDSATPEETYNLTLAFQLTSREHTLPRQIGTEPTVTVGGIAFGWTSPALTPEHAKAVMACAHALKEERA